MNPGSKGEQKPAKEENTVKVPDVDGMPLTEAKTMELLRELNEKGRTRRTPHKCDTASAKVLPHLFSLLAPQILTKKPTANEKAKEVVRQPMLSMFWDASSACYRVTITDKVLGTRVTTSVPWLEDLTTQVETNLREGRYEVKKIDGKVDIGDLVQ